eukprot:CAMPEP_0195130356 /NCGR_PEP_ID=MMETSP0448-20130528/143109_1 /TAXON_ID=66468 /ORGANISM="Heterocapsa triquestra, Strain CCMP 448" /LENGTH=115 /DNA_ID=CAMNT_0040168259 /DNA_START=202 /DNA_END=545 /DNA_ORIENTATION=+
MCESPSDVGVYDADNEEDAQPLEPLGDQEAPKDADVSDDVRHALHDPPHRPPCWEVGDPFAPRLPGRMRHERRWQCLGQRVSQLQGHGVLRCPLLLRGRRSAVRGEGIGHQGGAA